MVVILGGIYPECVFVLLLESSRTSVRRDSCPRAESPWYLQLVGKLSLLVQRLSDPEELSLQGGPTSQTQHLGSYTQSLQGDGTFYTLPLGSHPRLLPGTLWNLPGCL